MVGHVNHIKVKFEYQGPWVTVIVTLVKCQTPNTFAMINVWYYHNAQSQDNLKVIPESNCKC